jgi:N-acetylglucosamine-6-phosphate deacetylase
VEDGVCKLMDRSAFAGSIATADVLIRTLTKDCGVAMPTAVKMLTKVPAEILQVNKGELKVGRDADVVVFDEDINIQGVFLAGQKVC